MIRKNGTGSVNRKSESAAAYTAVTGKEETKLEIPIDIDKDYVLTVYAENESGKSQEAVKEFIFKYEDLMDELVEFEIKNLSAFSMDVEVKKGLSAQVCDWGDYKGIYGNG